MSSVKTSAFDGSGRYYDGRGAEIVKMGYLRKLKVCNFPSGKNQCMLPSFCLFKLSAV